jgi:uncharacterized protein YybS (DUF2232 family)
MDKPGLYPNGKALGWIVAGGFLSALFFFASVFVPLVGSFLGILAPIPLIVLSLRKDWAQGGLAALVAALFVGVALKPVVSLYFLVQFGMLGLIASALIERKVSFGSLMLISSLAVAAGFFLLIGAHAVSAHQGFFDILKKPLQANIQAILHSYPGLSGENARETAQVFRKMIALLIVLVPALIIIGSWMILLIDLYVIDRFRLLPGRQLLKSYDLNAWKAPEHFIWFVIVPGFAVFLLHGTLRVIAINILIVTLTAYGFQGLCIVNHYFTQKNVPPFLKFLFYFLMFILQIVAIMVVLLGLLDMWLNFRKLPHNP